MRDRSGVVSSKSRCMLERSELRRRYRRCVRAAPRRRSTRSPERSGRLSESPLSSPHRRRARRGQRRRPSNDHNKSERGSARASRRVARIATVRWQITTRVPVMGPCWVLWAALVAAGAAATGGRLPRTSGTGAPPVTPRLPARNLTLAGRNSVRNRSVSNPTKCLTSPVNVSSEASLFSPSPRSYLRRATQPSVRSRSPTELTPLELQVWMDADDLYFSSNFFLVI
ncbi:hypothetical protein EVAR_66923_1 [Eumeta japonica]|uniref:Uncharacterized protein n=1 Tax=Eumeta variegata TaxID=151549 RepID=A0A4C2A5L9_EUMVA|nr:hypothetical protein EVAR_66923_1 [Eumeta japonica]